MEPAFDGHYGREQSQKKGRTFYQGRRKQVARSRNAEQWTAYNKASRVQHITQHHNPLAAQVISTRTKGVGSTKFLKNQNNNNNNNNNDEDDDIDDNQGFLDEKSTEKILKMSKKQLSEYEKRETKVNSKNMDEDGDENYIEYNDYDEYDDDEEEDEDDKDRGKNAKKNKDKSMQLPPSQFDNNNNNNNSNNNNNNKNQRISAANLSLEELMKEDSENEQDDTQSQVTDNQPFEFQQPELTAAEEEALEMFMPQSKREQVTLKQVIINRYKENQAEAASTVAPSKIISKKLPRSVIQMYKDVGKICQSWKSGKLPKAFKMIPQLTDWEEILYLCNPEEWTPHVMYQAVKMFVSQAKASICQRFFNIVLLPRVREDIKDHKKLNFHLYQATKKALFKSQAFFKGFLLPLCQNQCTAREGVIIGSIISRTSIPVVHSALTMYKLLGMEYSGPCHYLLRIFLNKKYALPVKVIDALVKHFSSYEKDPRSMPVIWHQALLTFVQNYKSCLSHQQNTDLKRLLKFQYHKGISTQIKKELSQSSNSIIKNNNISSMDIDI